MSSVTYPADSRGEETRVLNRVNTDSKRGSNHGVSLVDVLVECPNQTVLKPVKYRSRQHVHASRCLADDYSTPNSETKLASDAGSGGGMGVAALLPEGCTYFEQVLPQRLAHLPPRQS